MTIRFISGAELRELMPVRDCIEAVREVMVAVSKRKVAMPLRHGMPITGGKGVLGMMYGCLEDPDCFGTKLISLYPGNPGRGLSSHLGLMILCSSENGMPLAITDGSTITAIRTAAASAVATDVLARSDASTLAILGGGEQALAHLHAIPKVRSISDIRIWCRSFDKARQFVKNEISHLDASITAIETVEEAVRDADIVCTVTSARDPVLQARWLQPGTHVNLVGSSTPDRSEADSDLVVKSRYFVDYRESTLAQAGEFLRAKNEGLIDDDHIVAEIGEVISGKNPGRQTDTELTVYKSLGVIAQDLIVANKALQSAIERGVGIELEM